MAPLHREPGASAIFPVTGRVRYTVAALKGDVGFGCHRALHADGKG